MTKTMKRTDVVVVGFGWAGAIFAKEMTEAGLNVVALERGEPRTTGMTGPYPKVVDELTYNARHKLMQDLASETVTVRHNVGQTALPYRSMGAFLLGTGVGGSGLHWSGVHLRCAREDLTMRTYYTQKYGAGFIPEDMTIQDWGLTYDDLEPHFAYAERVFGTSGTAWSVNGQIVGAGKGGNYFAPDRSTDFPLPAQKNDVGARIFAKAVDGLGYHSYNLPSANASGPYTNPYGCQMGMCNFCGFCSGYACYNYSKASPNICILPALSVLPNFELRTRCQVTKVELTPDGKMATGVTYFDASGEAVFQPADLVIVSAFQLHSVRLLLLSGIGAPYDPVANTGVVGRNFAYQNMGSINVFFDQSVYGNQFIGAGGNGIGIDDFNAGNFDHAKAGFVGGSPIWVNQAGTKPISGYGLPEGTPEWGSAWKAASRQYYTHSVSFGSQGQNPAYRGNYLSLDPTYRDKWGLPLLRMTFDWQPNDIALAQFMGARMQEIGAAMGGKAMKLSVKKPGDQFDVTQYQTTHLNGGAAMGTDPTKSAVNTYLQSWDVPNVFVPGASCFPQGLGYNPTGVVAATAYRAAKEIRARYLQSPGALS